MADLNSLKQAAQSTSFKVGSILVIVGVMIWLHVLASFNPIDITIPFTNQTITVGVLPFWLRMILRFSLAAAWFVIVIVVMIYLHVRLILLAVSSIKSLWAVYEAAIEFLDKM